MNYKIDKKLISKNKNANYILNPNNKSIKIFKETDNGKNITICKDVDDLFRKLEI